MAILINLLFLWRLVKPYHSHQIFNKMKKIAYLFVAFAFFGAIALSSCKSKTTEPAATEETVVEEVVEAAVDSVEAVVDSVAAEVAE
ncbi:MAG: hypothetical protein JXQ80_00600 [Bacteroidales bacterium]|nr:hypothetical protein [Bacteroidales bacterium]